MVYGVKLVKICNAELKLCNVIYKIEFKLFVFTYFHERQLFLIFNNCRVK